MFKRITLLAVGLLAMVAAVVVPASPAAACKLGCSVTTITVSPHGGFAGYNTATITWQVTNEGSSPVTVAASPGATGCAMLNVPYVDQPSLTLDAFETVTVHTYIKAQCAGDGRAWLSAGQDQGWQDVIFN